MLATSRAKEAAKTLTGITATSPVKAAGAVAQMPPKDQAKVLSAAPPATATRLSRPQQRRRASRRRNGHQRRG